MQDRVLAPQIPCGERNTMIIDFEKGKNTTEQQKLLSLRDSVQRALDEQATINDELRKMIDELRKKVEG